jgi:hypothetical protein
MDKKMNAPSEGVGVVVENKSSWPIHATRPNKISPLEWTNAPAKLVMSQKTTGTKTLQRLREGDSFYSTLPDGRIVSMGTVGLLREKSDQAGWNHVGHVTNSVLGSHQTGMLKIGQPVEFRDDKIFCQKTSLKSYTGGVPWVDVVNMTNISLSFYTGKTYTAPCFTVQPGDRYRYEGRYHWGVNYGTWMANKESVFAPVQINSPITHLIYGVL